MNPNVNFRARTYVFALVLVCVLTMLVVAIVALSWLNDAEREANKAQLLSTVRALAAAVDVKLKVGAAELEALAASPSLDDKDLARFYEQCQKIIRPGTWLILSDPTGQAIFNTRFAFGTLRPLLRSADLVKEAVRTRSVQISGAFRGATQDHFQVSVFVPVIEEDRVTHVLMKSFELSEISKTLLDQTLPASWTVAVIDRNNLIVASNRAGDEFGGTPATQSLVDRIAQADEAVFNSVNKEGVGVVTAITKSAYSGWTVALGIPASEVEAPFTRSLKRMGLLAGTTVLLGIFFAALIASRLSSSLSQISMAALSVGRGMPAPVIRTRVIEINDVAQALGVAGDLIKKRSEERDTVEEQLRRSEERFRDIAEVSSNWIWEMGPDLRFTYHEGAHEGRARLQPGAMIGQTRWELVRLDPETDEAMRLHKMDLEAHRPFHQFRFVTKADGPALHLSVGGKPFFDETGRFLGYRGATKNETEVVEARERAERAEALLHDAVDSISAGFTIFDAQNRLVMFNEGNRRLYGDLLHLRVGITFEEMLREGLGKEQFADSAGREEAWLAKRLAQFRSARGSIEQRLHNGHWLLITDRRMRNGGVASLRVDITELKQAQAALLDSEERLDRAQAIAGVGSSEWDLRTNRNFWSKQMYYLRGAPEEFDPSIEALVETIHEDDRQRVIDWFERLKGGERVEPIELRICRLDTGELRIFKAEAEPIFDASGAVTRVSQTLRDITELKRAEQERRDLEAQLYHSQKMESLGTLAGGIAHDLNNTLVPVLLMAKLGMSGEEKGSALYQNFQLIHQAGQRAAGLVKQILTFSRKDVPLECSMSVHETICDALIMLQRSVPSTITFATDIRPVPEIVGDPGQIHQIILNLVTNAAHAIGEAHGTISVSLAEAVQETPQAHRVIRLVVRDTGCGMEQQTMKRIFEPFFSTKEVGEGTGLGLSVVHGIVTAYGGRITVDSRPGRGTAFTVDLPLKAQIDQLASALQRITA
jgi:PAS domain S-box-containing protein